MLLVVGSMNVDRPMDFSLELHSAIGAGVSVDFQVSRFDVVENRGPIGKVRLANRADETPVARGVADDQLLEPGLFLARRHLAHVQVVQSCKKSRSKTLEGISKM